MKVIFDTNGRKIATSVLRISGGGEKVQKSFSVESWAKIV